MIEARHLPEPDLEFGYDGRHQEQRAGLVLHGPADIQFVSRPTVIRCGMVGQRKALDELQAWLEGCAMGVPARTDTRLDTLFPAFPGLRDDTTFRVDLAFPRDGRRELTRSQLSRYQDASTKAGSIQGGCRATGRRGSPAARRSKRRRGTHRPTFQGPRRRADTAEAIGWNFHDVLKARCITASVPIQVIRPSTWRGGRGVEDPATRAWNLMTALYYKAGGKPWRLARERYQRDRCFIGISFARADAGDQLHTSVAQVFNELGDGVIVRGALARRSEKDKQPHLAERDAAELLTSSLRRYKDHHGNQPAEITLHKSSAFSHEERSGFLNAAEAAELHSCDLVWISEAEDAFLVRGTSNYPPLRGTLLTLDDDQHALYTHGGVPYYKTYPGLRIPRPLGIRLAETDRGINEIAAEVLALSKLNWNRARLDARMPITLLTARRVGDVLRHVPAAVTPAFRYAFYM